MTSSPEPGTVATSSRGTVARSSGRLREAWAQGRPAVGVWSMLADPVVAELLGACDADYVVVDLQHGAATWADLPSLCQAMRAGGRAPLVRVPWNEPVHVMRALDCGAAGVVVPMVDSADDALRAAREHHLAAWLSSTLDGPWGIAAGLQLASSANLGMACGLATLELFDARLARALPAPKRRARPDTKEPGPVNTPGPAPTAAPTSAPTSAPTAAPTSAPTARPTPPPIIEG